MNRTLLNPMTRCYSLTYASIDACSFINRNKHPMNARLTDVPPQVSVAWYYSGIAVTLHWLLALLLLTMAALGWYMMSIEEQAGSNWYFELHKSIGIVVALLVVTRIAWRINHRPKTLPPTVPVWQTWLSKVTQTMLYLLMVLMPITGYLGASYSKTGVKLFGEETPRWTLPDHDLSEQLFGVHAVLIWVLIVLIGLHVVGALNHRFIRKDGVFQRMSFKRQR